MSEFQSSNNVIGDNKVNIHDFADVSPKAELGKGVYVGSGAVIGPDVIVGPNTWIGPNVIIEGKVKICLLYTSPSPRDRTRSRMPSSA